MTKKASKKKAAKKGGRPSIHTPAIERKILEAVANGSSLHRVCQQPGMPHESTFRQWVLDDRPKGLAARWEVATKLRAHAIADEIIDIVDDGRNDWMEMYNKKDELIGWRVNGEAVQRSRLRAESRFKLLAKIAPAEYGEKVHLHQTKDLGDATEEEIIDEIKRQVIGAGGAEQGAMASVLEELLKELRG